MTLSSAFWTSQRVLVTGGSGFLGSHVMDRLKALPCQMLSAPRSRDADLRQTHAIEKVLDEARPTLVIHLAALCGGIGANQASPGSFFYDNAIMGIQLMEAARKKGVQKFVQIGTVCAYPKLTPVPFKESDLWNGYPEETNAPYGLAKKMLLVQAQAYRAQYGFNAIYLLPTNLYGPRDHMDAATSHVIPALMQKFIQAKEKGNPTVSLWGTGSASRDFFYVEDAADGILLASERYNEAEPLNLGTGHEITIRSLAEKIQSLVGFQGSVVWDISRPDGQPRRSVDNQRAQALLGFKPRVSIDAGLQRTYDWFQQHSKEHSK